MILVSRSVRAGRRTGFRWCEIGLLVVDAIEEHPAELVLREILGAEVPPPDLRRDHSAHPGPGRNRAAIKPDNPTTTSRSVLRGNA